VLVYCRYALVLNVGSKSVQRSIRAGFGQTVRKSDMLTFLEEQIILTSTCCSMDHPHGLNNQMVVFCLRNFFIRGQFELRATSPKQFKIHVNSQGDEYLRFGLLEFVCFLNLSIEFSCDFGVLFCSVDFSFFLRYLPCLSKTIKTDMYHCNAEAMRPPVDCYSKDVVNTFKILLSHWPVFSSEELEVLFKGSQQPLFLVPKKVKTGDDVWFMKKPMGINTLTGTMKMLVESVGIDPKGRNITKKPMQQISIFRMEESKVPVKKGMRITSHHDHKLDAKYRANYNEVEDRVYQDVISGTTSMVIGKCLQFDNILQLEKQKQNLLKESR
jgi:hypothetical protein